MTEFQYVYINIIWIWMLLVMVYLTIQKGLVQAVWTFMWMLAIFWFTVAIIATVFFMMIIFWSIVHSYNDMTNPEFYWNYLTLIIQIVLFFGSIWIYTLIKENTTKIETKISNETIVPVNTITGILINDNSPEKLELMSSLSQIDISNIASVTFIPTNWQGFSIKTPNIKRLAVYITTKLGKTTFAAEELRKAFDHVVANISSDLSKTDFDLVQWKINEFVKSGGEVKIEMV